MERMQRKHGHHWNVVYTHDCLTMNTPITYGTVKLQAYVTVCVMLHPCLV